MADGRWLRISETRTSDGGCVQTRADITQMKEREADLLRLTRDLHSRNAMFDVLLDNMSQGLCLFDADQRVVFANHRYAEIYGLQVGVHCARHQPERDPGGTAGDRSLRQARMARNS